MVGHTTRLDPLRVVSSGTALVSTIGRQHFVAWTFIDRYEAAVVSRRPSWPREGDLR